MVGSQPVRSVTAVSITPLDVGCAAVIGGSAFSTSHADCLLQMVDVIARALLKQEEEPSPRVECLGASRWFGGVSQGVSSFAQRGCSPRSPEMAELGAKSAKIRSGRNRNSRFSCCGFGDLAQGDPSTGRSTSSVQRAKAPDPKCYDLTSANSCRV